MVKSNLHVCSFQGTSLTDMFFQPFKGTIFYSFKSLVIPVLCNSPSRLVQVSSSHRSSSGTAPFPTGLTFRCLFYLHQDLPVLFFCSGGHLLSHTVSSAVPSAAWVLTVVFGMGTGVSPRRIAARSIEYLMSTRLCRRTNLVRKLFAAA